MKKLLMPALRIFTSVFLIIILLYIMRSEYGNILRTIKGTNPFIFIFAFLAFITAISAASLRLKLLIDIQKIPVTFFEALSLTFIGYFFNNFLPTAIGGDFVKAYYLSKKTHNKTGAYASVFVDRAVGLFTMIFMAFGALFLVSGSVADIAIVRRAIYIVTLLAALVIFFAFNKKFAGKFSALLSLVKPVEEKLRDIYNTVHIYKDSKILILKSVVISFISQFLFFTSLGVMGLSIGSRIPMMDLLLKMPLVGFCSLLPSINGLGVREGSTVVFFGPIIGRENAFALSILWLAMLLIVSLFGGIIYAVSPQFKVKLKGAK